MPCQFINRYPAGDGLLRAYLAESAAKDLSWACLALGALGVLLSMLLGRAGMPVECGLCLGLGLLSLAAAAGARTMPFRKTTPACGQAEGTVEFGSRIRVTERGETFWADYGQIVRVRRMKSLSVLLLENGEAIVLDNQGFVLGGPEGFWPFLEEMRARQSGCQAIQ